LGEKTYRRVEEKKRREEQRRTEQSEDKVENKNRIITGWRFEAEGRSEVEG
jgi:hypothetical protein